jgi:periplasmic mercuric ion binding protein
MSPERCWRRNQSKELAMTRFLAVLSLAATALASGSAFGGERTVTLAVDNMYCDACPYIVKQSLAKIPGVEDVAVSYEQRTATVTYDDEKTTLDALMSATTQAGYPSRATP